MSGIAGIIHFREAPLKPRLIETLTDAMSHRGPDGTRFWVQGRVELGLCMLKTSTHSFSDDPSLASEDGNFAIVLDGRLDNREEILSKLRSSELRTQWRTDPEIVLAAFRLWGDESPRYLLGDFAYAIWDKRRELLFCARDHFGVKPLYYFEGKDYLAFASEEEAFFGLPGFSGEPWDNFVASSLSCTDIGDMRTESWLKGIFKLPAGNTLISGPSVRLRVAPFWQIAPIEELRLGSDLEYEEAFRYVFSEAVRCRLDTCGNPSVMLSGGIDSASIAGTARSLLSDGTSKVLNTFSVVDSDSSGNAESKNIRLLAQGYEKESFVFTTEDSSGFISDEVLQAVAWDNVHPIGNHILLPALMYRAASMNGNRVMFDGIHGDAVVGSDFLYMSDHLRSGDWRLAWKESLLASVNHSHMKTISPFLMFAKGVWHAFAPLPAKELKAFARNVSPKKYIQKWGLNQDFVQELQLVDRFKQKQALDIKRYSEPAKIKHINALMPEIPWAMEGFDAVGSRFGVEPGHPWSDKRLVEFCMQLPLSQRTGSGWTKSILRRAMTPILSEQVVWHKGKNHFGINLVRRLMEVSECQVEEALVTANQAAGRYVDVGSLQRLHHRWQESKADTDTYRLFSLVSLLLWMKRIHSLGRNSSS